VRKPATSGGACCAGTLGDLRVWGERLQTSDGSGGGGGRRLTRGSSGGGGSKGVGRDERERRVWSAAAQEKGGGQAGVQGMEELGFVLSVFLYQWSAIRV